MGPWDVLANKAVMEAHRATITQQIDGSWRSDGPWEELITTLHIADHVGQPLPPIQPHVRAAANRLSYMRTAVSKLDWMRQLRDGDQLEELRWLHYAGSDVVNFLAEIDTLCDELLRVRPFLPNPGVTGSFARARQRFDDNPALAPTPSSTSTRATPGAPTSWRWSRSTPTRSAARRRTPRISIFSHTTSAAWTKRCVTGSSSCSTAQGSCRTRT